MTSSTRRRPPGGAKPHSPHFNPIELAIDERASLANAESALRVLKVALMHQEPEAASSPYYANVVEFAANTIARSIRALDSLSLTDATAEK